MPKNSCWGVGEVSEARQLFSALPGYPFLPCPICKRTGSCDHTVLERAQATHPGLVLYEHSTDSSSGAETKEKA